MSATFSKVELITGVARRRRFTTEQKLSVVSETLCRVEPLRPGHDRRGSNRRDTNMPTAKVFRRMTFVRPC
jgi:hypothetical protein